MNKQAWLDGAEVFDAWRVVPRVMLAGFGAYVLWVTWYILHWYTTEPATARGTEESAVVSVIFTAIAGMTPWVFKIYTDSGTDWRTQDRTTFTSTKTVTTT